MRRLLFIALLLFMTLPSIAVPADPTPFQITLQDGSTVMVRVVGDESFHYMSTLTGIPVVRDEEGLYRLAPEQKDEIEEMRLKRFEEMASLRMESMARKAGERSSKAAQRTNENKKKKGIVILVNFADKTMPDSRREELDRQYNAVGYTDNGCVGSVHDYFYDNTNGFLDYSFDVYGPVTVSEGYKHYGGNTPRQDWNVDDLLEEACKLADAEYDIDWSLYDNDADKEVDQVICVYAGQGEHSVSDDPDLIWAKQASLTDLDLLYNWFKFLNLSFDNVKIDKFLVVPELAGDGSLDGIGMVCHEFCHTLGLKDHYDTKANKMFGTGYWDLMADGNYNGPTGKGECPAGLTAFERYQLGCGRFLELKTRGTYTLPAWGSEEGYSYFIKPESATDITEYVVLENRQNNKWFQYVHNIPSVHGLFVYRVTENKDLFIKNEVNGSADEQCMVMIPASKSYDFVRNQEGFQSLLFTQDECSSLITDSHKSVNGFWHSSGYDFKWGMTDIAEFPDVSITFNYYADYQKEWKDPSIVDDGNRVEPDRLSIRYWFDDSTEPQVTDYTSLINLDLSGLTEGLHTLYTQIVDEYGYASNVNTQFFYNNPKSDIEYKFWFDDQDQIDLTGSGGLDYGIPTEKLSEGIHTLYVQATHGGIRSNVASAFFYKFTDAEQTRSLQVIYSFDGIEEYQATIVLDKNEREDGRPAEVTGVLSLDSNELRNGDHSLSYYIIGQDGYYFAAGKDAFLKGRGVRGDIDGDGKVSAVDLSPLVMEYLINNVDEENVYHGDMNDDGKISISDITAIIGSIIKDQLKEVVQPKVIVNQ